MGTKSAIMFGVLKSHLQYIRKPEGRRIWKDSKYRLDDLG